MTFSSGSTSVCTVSGATFTFIAVGSCIVRADQAGNTNWNAATQTTQSFTVGKGDQTITFTSTAPTAATVGGATYTAAATATSSLAVAFTSATPAVCTSGGANGATITFIAAGTCTVNANQAGNANWNAAPQVQQSFTVSMPLNATALAIDNGTGTNNKADQGDVVVITFNQAIQLSSVCSSWTSGAQTVTNVTVTMDRGNGSSKNDLSLTGGTIGATACTGGIRLGTFTTNTSVYEGANNTHAFTGSTVTWNAATNKVTVTLGSCGASCPPGTATSNNTYLFDFDTGIALNSNPAVTISGTKPSVTGLNF